MKKEKDLIQYNVITWNFNHDELEFYDIMPYLIICYNESKNKPKTFEECKEFVNNKSKYQFWCRCEYEVIVTGWPIQKNEHKLDVYAQIEKNLDIVTKIFMENIEIK